ncbi:hypothetical protein [uncultured Gammaproteobacteria bacterium]|nr:hypothetical protein [uncultured Gammaproteobacteria bacterium]
MLLFYLKKIYFLMPISKIPSLSLVCGTLSPTLVVIKPLS